MRQHTIGYTLWPANFELTDPGRFMDEADAMGVDTVEIQFFTTRLIAEGKILEPAMRWFEGHARNRSYAFTAHAMLTINFMDVPEAIAEHEAVARANVELAARLGARILVVHCGLTHERDPRAVEAAYGRQRDALSRLGDVAAEHGVTVCVETIWNFDGRETALPSRLAAELRAVDHPNVAGCLDFAHAALQSTLKQVDFFEECRAIAPLSPHLHLNDCFQVEKGLPIALPAEAMAYGTGDLHLPIGWGSIPWERVLTELPYPDSAITLNQELHPTYWYALPDDVAEMRRLAALMDDRRGVPASAAV